MSGRKLGRGLEALIRRSQATPTDGSGDGSTDAGMAERAEVVLIDPARIHANRDQPRSHFDDEAIEELARSVSADGILQPLVVRDDGKGGFELVAGERRLRAAQQAGLDQVPVLVRDIDDDQMLPLALAENIQREDLNPIELARAYRALQESFGWTQEQLAKQVRKKRSSIANSLRFLDLEPQIQDSLIQRIISAGHAKLLLSVSDSKLRKQWFKKVLSNKWTVRDLDEALRGGKSQGSTPSGKKKAGKKNASGAETHVIAEEERLGQILGTKVAVLNTGPKGRGKIVIEFFSHEDYDRIARIVVGGKRN
ncbi:MAG: ParB/RepB/Spo0J family partition protein [Planctomycetota bacterium]|nr:ParB/RepB/Spo0J family partition protein [Planctomycetota bacterium]